MSIKKFIIDLRHYWMRWLLVLTFSLYTLWTSWICDDAYHAFVMARNLVEGKGFVYNVGYRVTATTCPLYTLITALFYAVIRDMFLAGIIQGVFFSTLAIYIVLFKLCKSDRKAVVSLGIMVCCYSFMVFTTSGLENSLLFFLSALFVYFLSDNDLEISRKLFVLAFLLSLMAMTRMDSVLMFVPVICYMYLVEKDINFWRRVGIGLGGLSPFIIWELFSLVYYGYPFPNTMYIKLSTGIDKAEYYSRGIDYIFHSSLMDVLLLIVPIVLIILAIIRKLDRVIYLSLGLVMYWMYVISIGGDFMIGRHLTVPFFVALIVIVDQTDTAVDTRLNVDRILLVILIVGVLAGNSSYLERNAFFVDTMTEFTGCTDEKAYYFDYTSLRSYINSKKSGFDSVECYSSHIVENIRVLQDAGLQGACFDLLPGIATYYAQNEKTIYLTDKYGLMDPLLSHLPAATEEGWRIGHMYRDIPNGYLESLAYGSNQISDNSLHEFYDYVLIITQGTIWDIDRFKVIINMNLGNYDYLVDEYISRL